MSIVADETARGDRREEVSELIAKRFSARATDLLPLYRRLHESVEELIRSGSLQPGTQMPPEQKKPMLQSAFTTQSPAHWVAPQRNGVQFCVCSGGQLPVPVQKAGSVATPLVHDASRHSTLPFG